MGFETKPLGRCTMMLDHDRKKKKKKWDFRSTNLRKCVLICQVVEDSCLLHILVL